MARRRPPRLPNATYIGFNRYSLTICAARGTAPFRSKGIVDPILAQLRHYARSSRFALPAFCFMTDHLHVVAEATHDTSNLLAFMKLFKQQTAFDYRRATGTCLWEQGYYDRVIRKDDDLLTVVVYVLSNPIRAGLVESIFDWPFSGSDVFRIEDLEAVAADRGRGRT